MSQENEYPRTTSPEESVQHQQGVAFERAHTRIDDNEAYIAEARSSLDRGQATWMRRDNDDTDGYVVDYFDTVDGAMRHIGFVHVDTPEKAIEVYVNDRIAFNTAHLLVSKPQSHIHLAQSVSLLESTVPIPTQDVE